MKKITLFVIVIILAFFGTYFFLNRNQPVLSPLGKIIPEPKPLLVYTFNNLKKTKFIESPIKFGDVANHGDLYFSQIFYFMVPEKTGQKPSLKVSGLGNFPTQPGTYPLIVMLRGFVPGDSYKPGAGTQPVAQVFARKGFITLAPDFLDFGKSASGSADPFEDRFQTYTTVLTLLASLKNINQTLKTTGYQIDLSRIGIWGHSNGGHIALATLEISGVNYPTVLWAPVSKSFPYSILYYTDEADDQGKSLRKLLARFEQKYNTDQFSPTNYFSWIKAPLEIHQGTSDQEVPVWWSDNLVKILKKDKISVEYFTYFGADHNLLPDAWSQAVLRSVDFYKQQFKKQE